MVAAGVDTMEVWPRPTAAAVTGAVGTAAAAAELPPWPALTLAAMAAKEPTACCWEDSPKSCIGAVATGILGKGAGVPGNGAL